MKKLTLVILWTVGIFSAALALAITVPKILKQEPDSKITVLPDGRKVECKDGTCTIID